MSDLALYDHAKEAIAAAVSFDEITKIHGDARKAEAYARVAKDRKLVADAQEIVARAERKLGILLRRVKESGMLSQGGRPAETSNLYSGSGPGQKHAEPETGADTEPVFDNTPFTLADIGVDKKLSSRAQKAAALDDAAFEAGVTERRERTLSAGAPVVSPPKTVKVESTPKPERIKALEPRRFHQFAFSIIAMAVASDRVSSEALLFLAETCGVLERDGEVVDFTPEAIEAFGSLATAALKALDGDQDQGRAARRVTVVTENGASGEAAAASPDTQSREPHSYSHDARYAEAIAVVRLAQSVSPSLIQRRLSIGYNLASRLIEWMERDGIVSRADETGQRNVLSTISQNTPEGSGTAREAGASLSSGPGQLQGQPLPGYMDIGGLKQGAEPDPHPKSQEPDVAFLLSENLRPTVRHSKHTAEPILRARYESEPTEVLAAELGVPVNTVRTWAYRLGLTSRQRISDMATARNQRKAAP